MKATSRRLKSIRISDDVLLDTMMFRRGRGLTVYGIVGLPDDVVGVDIYFDHDPLMPCVVLTLESAEFEEVPLNERVPSFLPLCEQFLLADKDCPTCHGFALQPEEPKE